MEPLVGAIHALSQIFRVCDIFSKLVSDLRSREGRFEGLMAKLSSLRIEIDRLNELEATIQKVNDRIEELEALEETMTETIVAAEQVFSLLEQSSPAVGLRRISATRWKPSEWRKLQSRVDKVDTCIVSLRIVAFVVMHRYSEPNRLLDKAPRGYPGRFDRDGPNEALQTELSFGKGLGNEKGSPRGRDGGDDDGPGSGDVSKLARCGLVATTVAGSLVMSGWELRPDLPFDFISKSTVEILGLKVVDLPSMASVLKSPATLIIAATATSTALTTHHYFQRDRKHQDVFIIGAVAAGIAGGWLYDLDGTSILLRVAPWCALLGLLMSGCSPMRQKQDWRTDEMSDSCWRRKLADVNFGTS